MSDMNNNDNFEIFGLPENNIINIPNKKKDAKSGNIKIPLSSLKEMIGEINTLTPEQFKKEIPPDLLKMMENVSKSNGTNVDDMIEDALKTTKEMLKNGMNTSKPFLENLASTFTGDADTDLNVTKMLFMSEATDENSFLENMLSMINPNDDNCEDEEEEEQEEDVYTLSETDWLFPEDFGSIPCIEDENIYDNFVKKFGTDSTKYIDRIGGIQKYVLDDVTSQLPINSITDLKYIGNDNKSILFYASTSIPNTFGFFISVFKNPDGEFEVYIPNFMNTFEVFQEEDSEEYSVELYKPLEHSFFTVEDNGATTFDLLNIPLLIFATNFVLAPKKRVLLNPHQFGTIKNSRASIRGNTDMLCIGTIESNEGAEAILFKKDSDLDLDKKVFPMYIKFPEEVNEIALKKLSEILFEVDFNKCILFDNLELHHTNDGKLFVNLNLGEF